MVADSQLAGLDSEIVGLKSEWAEYELWAAAPWGAEPQPA